MRFTTKLEGDVARCSRRWQRWIRSLVRLWRWTPVVWFDEQYQSSISGVPLDPLRGAKILTFLSLENLVGRREVRRPLAVSMELLRRVHSDAYLEELQRPGALTLILGMEVAQEEQDHVLSLQRLMVGGTVAAAEQAWRSGGIGFHLGGGFHHASPNRGEGFCVFNDIVAAVLHLRDQGFSGKILVVDCDLHDGDGTRAAFAEDATVHTFSIHNHHLGPTDVLEATSVELGSGIGDHRYIQELEQRLPELLASFRPELVIYLAGADPAADDQIGDWEISARGMMRRDRLVVSAVRKKNSLPLVVLLAGGYGSGAWRYGGRLASLLLSGRFIEPPSNEMATMARLRHLAKLLPASTLMGEKRDDDFGLTEEDVMGGLGVHGRETRFLGYYSTHGIELALERYAYLAQIRAMGFPRPRLSFELHVGAAHRMRLYGDETRRLLLLELVARRDGATIREMELLHIEWLLLQNPRVSFPPGRPPLPGQEKPGLGLLHETVALLLLVCQRLDLDGLAFVPSKYHLAKFGEGQGLRFLDPVAEARLIAMKNALGRFSLSTASWLVEKGGLVDVQTGKAAVWEPSVMVLPWSASLKEKLEDPDYKELVVVALPDFRYKAISESGRETLVGHREGGLGDAM